MDGLGLIRKQRDIENKVNELLETKNFRIVQTTDERDALTDIKNGEICFVVQENVYYSRMEDEWDVFNSGSGNGGGAIIGTLTSTLDQKTISVTVDEPIDIDLFFATPNIGRGTVYVLSNGKELLKESIKMGANNISVTLAKGAHKIEVYVVDRANVYTNSITFNVQCGGLDISTTFKSDKDYAVGTFITFPYNIDTVSTKPIKTYFKIGSETYETDSRKGYNTYLFPKLGAGTHRIEIWSESGDYESNKLIFTLVMLDSDSLFVSSLFDQTEVEEGDQVIIDYRVSMKGVKNFIVEYFIDGVFLKKGTAYNGTNTVPISNLTIGNRTIKIKVSTEDQQHSAEIEIVINVNESSYEMKQPVEGGLLAWFDAYGLSNQDLDNNIWRDKSGNGYEGRLHNFNYTTNGWINNGLKMNGNAYAELNISPFAQNAETGLTIDVEFMTEDIGNENARVFDCTTRLSSHVGCYIDTNKAMIRSNANEVKPTFAQCEKTRVTYVIDRLAKLTKVYINAVLCEVAFLTDMGDGNDERLEDFKHSEHIFLNSQKGELNFGDCTVYNVRVYGRALSSDEVLENHIADIKDKKEQKKKWDFNHSDTIPTMYFYGEQEVVDSMTKDNKVPLRIKYISTDDKQYGESFDLENCLVQWQGTSSLQYAIKNYKIRLQSADGTKFKRPLREGMIPESKFTLKADYMESSHANNTGAAKIVNRYLYDSKLPPQQDNEKVVSAIDGFPVKLYINDELIGVFNFNLDKGCEDSFGLDRERYPRCLSYEISANTDTTAGAFNKWTGVQGGPEELAYLKKDFELRYPDTKDDPDCGYLTDLKRVVDWVSSANDETFKREFEQYFNKEYTLKYYLFTLVFGMVDNLGKNMMLNTWDGNIWYPCFYDLDTCLALDNSGYIKFDVDIEMESGTYNTSGSKLWTKVAKVFKDEIEEMYRTMRGNSFKEANLFKVLIDEQIDQIPESLYNLDSQQKYLNFGKSYIHMLHGSRREHMRKWLTERLLYLDSKMGYEETTKESITIRANKQGYVYFNIKTYSPMYIKIRWRNGEETLKKVGRDQTVQYSYRIPTATDQEIFIYSANHLKEIGDLSSMTPTSLSLAGATRLTKLICTNNSKLQALGIGGVVNGKNYNLKNLQEIDLTGCTNLGTVSGNNGLDLSYCDNLKKATLWATSLRNVTFNVKGGNLEELYLPNTVTSLHLKNQYNLRKVVFPSFSKYDSLHHNNAHKLGSQITDLSIINCPKLQYLGMNNDVYKSYMLNYRGNNLEYQSDSFDIPTEEYMQIFKMGCLGSLETINITNSLSSYRYICVHASPNLARISLDNMPNLKGVIFTGNRVYSNGSYPDEDNIDGIPQFEGLLVNKCDNFDTVILQKCSNKYEVAFKFKEDFTWDLSNIPLKRFICNIALQNLKKIILPSSVEEFSHSSTVLMNTSKSKYTKEMSPLETIVIAGQHDDDDFKGIDLGNIQLKNVSFNGLTQPVEIIKNINCEAIDVNPRFVSEHFAGTSLKQPMGNVIIDFNKYKLNSLKGTFFRCDMSQLQIILDHNITTENMDYTDMMSSATNVPGDNIREFLKKLPPGKLKETFRNCDIDKKLEIGHMIGPSTTSLNYAFFSVGAEEINLQGADFSNVTTLYGAFYQCPNLIKVDLTGVSFENITDCSLTFAQNSKLETILGIENIIHEKVTSIGSMFSKTPKLKFNFENGKPNWRFNNSTRYFVSYFMRDCGSGISLSDQEEYVLDLSECGSFQTQSSYDAFNNSGFTKVKMNGTRLETARDMFRDCKNLTELEMTNMTFVGQFYNLTWGCPKLVTINMEGSDMSKTTDISPLASSSVLTNLKFGTGLTTSLTLNHPLLTVDSLMSVINNLGIATSSSTRLYLGETNLAKLTAEQKKIATDKKWTLA